MAVYRAVNSEGQTLYKSTAPFAADWLAENGYRMVCENSAPDEGGSAVEGKKRRDVKKTLNR
ncbi:hypothetical protein [Neisseria wadsworthii]|uniref:Peptidyl-tRNA hydrolase n=1 Tax=Neisseria wadsworthii 9715 TaxID=1030841 RepID=G4CPH9_9NEIS|nr:hypothetical protein [Neisseria wadsworthii]EGZ47742.1 peptidyl-tRNA hydrolase [Neisseria wadsworthii 9715]